MKIKLLRATVIRGHDGAKVGDIIEVRDDVGFGLVITKRAVEVRDEPPVLQTRDPIVEHRDPAIIVAGDSLPGRPGPFAQNVQPLVGSTVETVGGTVRPRRLKSKIA